MSVALLGGTIITPFKMVENGAIVIQNGKIFELGKTKDVDIPDNCEVIDVSGRAICSRFIDFIRMVYLNERDTINVEQQKDELAVGKDADILIINESFEVEMVISKGKIAYTKTYKKIKDTAKI